MATTLLDVIKGNDSLYALLQKEPTSKLLRSYIKKQFNLNSLPVLVTLEEWEEWLSAQSILPMKRGSTSVTQPSSVLLDYLKLASREETVEAYQNYNYCVRGMVSVVKDYYTNFRTLLESLDSNDLMTVLSPILECETEEELDSLNRNDIVSNLEFHALQQLKDFVRYRGSGSYDSGDIDISDEELDEVDDLETYGLSEELENFVEAAIEHRRRQILDG